MTAYKAQYDGLPVIRFIFIEIQEEGMNFSRIPTKKVLTVLGILILSSSAFSAAHADNINRQQARQDMRIYQGVRSGAITHREAAMLERHDDRINRMENRFRADGHLSFRERQKLHRALNQNNRRILRQKHDRQRLSWSRFW
jgi:hypothetical protein